MRGHGECSGTPDAVPHKHRHLVAESAKAQIQRADVLVAWIETESAYGTLVEIGFAHALGKQIWLCGTNRFQDLWFAESFASRIHFYHRYTPAEFIARCLQEEGFRYQAHPDGGLARETPTETRERLRRTRRF